MASFERGPYDQPIVRCVLTVKNVPADERVMWLEETYEQVQALVTDGPRHRLGEIEVHWIRPVYESNPVTVTVANIVTYRPTTARERGEET